MEYQSKARVQFRIGLPLQVVYLLTVPRYNDLCVENRFFSHVLLTTGSFEAIARTVPWHLWYQSWFRKTSFPALTDNENRTILRSFVLSQYQRVTNRQTDTPPMTKLRSQKKS